MRIFGLTSFKESLTFVTILSLASVFMWSVFIYPNTLDWQVSDNTIGEVETLISNTQIMGPATVQAVVKLSDGQTAIVPVPIEADIRAGSRVELSVLVNADNEKQKRYRYAGALGSD